VTRLQIRNIKETVQRLPN